MSRRRSDGLRSYHPRSPGLRQGSRDVQASDGALVSSLSAGGGTGVEGAFPQLHDMELSITESDENWDRKEKGHTNHHPSMPPQPPPQPPRPLKPELPSRSLGTHPRCLAHAKQGKYTNCAYKQYKTLNTCEAGPLQRCTAEA